MNRLLFLILLPIVCLSQNEFNHWYFGNKASLDFNSGSVVAGNSSALQALEGSASVADCEGNLQFYTDGENVWTSSHVLMENGYDLKGEGGIYPSTQGALIVKRPKSASIYYIFTASDIFGLNYSVVNMSANGGAGKVIQKNVGLDFKPTQKLAVTYHANGEDIWLATHYENSDEFESFLVTQSGVSSNSVISYTGPVHKGAHGDMKFNQTGTKLGAVVQDQDMVSITSFNNNTGVFSGGFGHVGKYDNPHGVEFSANGRWMYVSAFGGSGGGVFQIDLLSGSDMLKNGVNISGGVSPSGSLQMAPDGQIYVADDQSLHLGIIRFPDEKGSDAEFISQGVHLNGKKSGWELPNVTLTNNVVIEPNDIVFSGICEDDVSDFGLLSEDGVISVLWDFGDPESLSNNSVLFSPQHLFSKSGDFLVTVTLNTVCGADVYQRLVTINSLPEIVLTDTSFCRNTDQQIGISPVIGDTYSWSPATGLSSSTISNPTIDLSALNGSNALYFLTATTSDGCAYTDSLLVDLLSLPEAGEDQVMCPGFEVGLAVDESAISVIWSPTANIDNSNSLNPVVSPLTSQYYFSQITDTNGCVNTDSIFVIVKDSVPVNAGNDLTICYGDTVQIGTISVNDNVKFQWTPNQNIINADSAIAKVFPFADQDYYLTTSIDTCTSRDTVSVSVNPLPLIKISPTDTSVCRKDTFKLLATGGVQYEWWSDVTGIAVGLDSVYGQEMFDSETFFVKGVDSNGCINYDTTLVSLLELPDLEITNDTSLCIGKAITLSVSGAKSYFWNEIDVTDSADSLVVVSPVNSLYYHVRGQGGNGCFSVDSVFVTVNSLPLIEMIQDTLVCEGEKAKLWARGGMEYSWLPTDSFMQSINRVQNVKVDIPVEYKVIVTDENSCVDSSTVFISTNVVPLAAFSFDTLLNCDGVNIAFSDSSADAETYSWFFGDGTFSSENDITHLFKYGSNQSPYLVVGNNGICFDTASVILDFPEISTYINSVIPNVITPNSDGMNECLEIDLPSYFEDCAVLEIYNRWGLKVHDSSVFKLNFCGLNSYNNKPLSNGTYFYTLTFGEYIMSGFITIVQ